MEEILFDLFVKQREDAKLIILKSVQRQGLKIFEENYKEEGKEFKCSIGWIQNWKKRHNIVYRNATHSQTSRDVNKQPIIDQFTSELEKLIEKYQYSLDSIVNIDETPVYWDSKRNRTLEKKVF